MTTVDQSQVLGCVERLALSLLEPGGEAVRSAHRYCNDPGCSCPCHDVAPHHYRPFDGAGARIPGHTPICGEAWCFLLPGEHGGP